MENIPHNTAQGYYQHSNTKSSFVICVNLLSLQSIPSLFLYGLFVSFKWFSIIVSYYFLVYFNLKVFLYMAKITHDIVT